MIKRDELNSFSFRPALNPKSVAIHKALSLQVAPTSNEANGSERATSPSSGAENLGIRKPVYEKLYEKH